MTQETIIKKLTAILEVQCIYSIKERATDQVQKTMLLIVLKKNSTTQFNEVVPFVNTIVEKETKFLYRIYSYGYTKEQLQAINLFFILNCKPSNVIYGKEIACVGQLVSSQTHTLKQAQHNFDKELEKVTAFRNGALYYFNHKTYNQAIFMLHQHVELLYRWVEQCLMGKEKVCHSIKNHQDYIKHFVPTIENLFDLENEVDNELLAYLDAAYKEVRYSNNYHVTEVQINLLLKKATTLHNSVVLLCQSKLNQFKQIVESKKEEKESDRKSHSLKKIKELSKENFKMLTPIGGKQGESYLNDAQ